MKAISILAPKKIEIIDVPVPELLDDELLIKVAYAGICGTDIGIYGGGLSFVKSGLIKYPVRIGHEFSGVVAKVGKNVTKFKVGDRVITDNGVCCRNHCKACAEGRYIECENLRSVGTVNCWEGAFAEYIKMPEIHTYHLPDSIGLEEAAVIEPVTISQVSLMNANALTPGKTVLVIGTGPIGLATANLAISYGASKVYIAGRKESKLDIARGYGAEAINVTEVDLVEYMKNVGKVDVTVETSGAIGCIEQACRSTKKHGTVALAGFYERTLDGFPIDDFVLSEVNLVGVEGKWIAQDIINLMVEGKLDLKPLISHRFTFEEAPQVIAEGDSPKYKDKIRMMVAVDPTLK